MDRRVVGRVLCVPAAVLAAEPGGPTASRSDSVTRVLVRFAADRRRGSAPTCARGPTSSATRRSPVRGLELVDPEPGVSVSAAVADLQRMDGVLYAEPDRVVRQTATPDDPLFSYEWDMTAIRAPEAWDVTTGSAQVPVAVVDTGIDASHPDLAANLWTNPGESRRRARDQRPRRRRQRPHRRRPRLGLRRPRRTAPRRQRARHPRLGHDRRARQRRAPAWRALNWSTAIMPLRVLGNDGSGYVSDVVTAYAYAARSGARVVNASLGGDSYSRAEHDAIAAAPNTLFVVAAGNDSADDDATPEYPCDYELANVVCVAASDRADALASFSNYGATNVDLAAPGVDIASTWPGGGYVLLDGTSMATPHVSGAAALLLAHDGGLTVEGLRAALLSSAHPVPALAGRVATGGRLDAAAALSVAPAPPEPPAAPPAAPVPPSSSPAPPRPRPTAPRPGSLCASIVAPCARSAPAACASPWGRRRPAARASTSGSAAAPPAACTCPRARSGARASASPRPDGGRHSPHLPPRAATRDARCASSRARSRWMPRAIAVGPSARRRCGAERLRAAGRLANVLPSPGPRRSGICNALAHSVGIGATRATRSGGNRTCQSSRCSRSAGATLRIDRPDRLLRRT